MVKVQSHMFLSMYPTACFQECCSDSTSYARARLRTQYRARDDICPERCTHGLCSSHIFVLRRPTLDADGRRCYAGTSLCQHRKAFREIYILGSVVSPYHCSTDNVTHTKTNSSVGGFKASFLRAYGLLGTRQVI